MKFFIFAIFILYLSKTILKNGFEFDVYPIILSLLFIIILPVFFKQKQNKDYLLFTFLIVFSFVFTTLVNHGLHPNYKNLIFLYIIQPIAIMSFFLTVKKEKCVLNAKWSLNLISYSTYATFLGGVYFYLVHLYNYPNYFQVFSIEFAGVGNEKVLRNKSFLGLSIVFCGVALIQFLSSKILYKNFSNYLYNFNAHLALISALFTLSRRAILPIIIYYIFYLMFSGLNIKLRVLSALAIACVSFAILTPELFNLVLERVKSIFDIFEKGNFSRVILMLEGLKDIVLNPWGLGFGALSSVGYTFNEFVQLKTGRVTESTFITLMGEMGLFIIFSIGILIYKYVKILPTRTFYLFYTPIIVESIVGLGLLSPIVSFLTIIFLISVFILETNKD